MQENSLDFWHYTMQTLGIMMNSMLIIISVIVIAIDIVLAVKVPFLPEKKIAPFRPYFLVLEVIAYGYVGYELLELIRILVLKFLR